MATATIARNFCSIKLVEQVKAYFLKGKKSVYIEHIKFV